MYQKHSNPIYLEVTTQPLPGGWFHKDIGKVNARVSELAGLKWNDVHRGLDHD